MYKTVYGEVHWTKLHQESIQSQPCVMSVMETRLQNKEELLYQENKCQPFKIPLYARSTKEAVNKPYGFFGRFYLYAAHFISVLLHSCFFCKAVHNSDVQKMMLGRLLLYIMCKQKCIIGLLLNQMMSMFADLVLCIKHMFIHSTRTVDDTYSVTKGSFIRIGFFIHLRNRIV